MSSSHCFCLINYTYSKDSADSIVFDHYPNTSDIHPRFPQRVCVCLCVVAFLIKLQPPLVCNMATCQFHLASTISWGADFVSVFWSNLAADCNYNFLEVLNIFDCHSDEYLTLESLDHIWDEFVGIGNSEVSIKKMNNTGELLLSGFWKW